MILGLRKCRNIRGGYRISERGGGGGGVRVNVKYLNAAFSRTRATFFPLFIMFGGRPKRGGGGSQVPQ